MLRRNVPERGFPASGALERRRPPGATISELSAMIPDRCGRPACSEAAPDIVQNHRRAYVGSSSAVGGRTKLGPCQFHQPGYEEPRFFFSVHAPGRGITGCFSWGAAEGQRSFIYWFCRTETPRTGFRGRRVHKKYWPRKIVDRDPARSLRPRAAIEAPDPLEPVGDQTRVGRRTSLFVPIFVGGGTWGGAGPERVL